MAWKFQKVAGGRVQKLVARWLGAAKARLFSRWRFYLLGEPNPNPNPNPDPDPDPDPDPEPDPNPDPNRHPNQVSRSSIRSWAS